METPLGRQKISLFRVRGMDINVDYSWFIIFLLILFSLSAGYFPFHYPDQSPWLYGLMGLVATLLFFASILIHEFAHAVMAQRSGIQIPGITLFIFGGMAHTGAEAKNPKIEAEIAIVGPLTSFALAGVFYLGWQLFEPRSDIIAMIFQYLSWINLALAVFNLVPAFPLDGGRVFRAVWWWKTGSLERGTRVASDLGKGFAYALMGLGALQIFAGALIGGVWFILIGLFLRSIAEGSYQDVILRKALESVSAKTYMTADPVTVPHDLPVDQAITEYFVKYGYRGFPVIDKSRGAVGMLMLSDLKDLPEEKRHSTMVQDLMTPISSQWIIEPETSLAQAFKQMVMSGMSRVLVMKDGTLLGMVTQKSLFRYVELKHVVTSSSSAVTVLF